MDGKLILTTECSKRTGPLFTSEYEASLFDHLGEKAHQILDEAAKRIDREVFVSLLAK